MQYSTHSQVELLCSNIRVALCAEAASILPQQSIFVRFRSLKRTSSREGGRMLSTTFQKWIFGNWFIFTQQFIVDASRFYAIEYKNLCYKSLDVYGAPDLKSIQIMCVAALRIENKSYNIVEQWLLCHKYKFAKNLGMSCGQFRSFKLLTWNAPLGQCSLTIARLQFLKPSPAK